MLTLGHEKKITVSISTTIDRYEHIKWSNLNQNNFIDWFIIIQIFNENLEKIDLNIHDQFSNNIILQQGKGLTRSRNLAIDLCKTKFLHITDDDIDLSDVNYEQMLIDICKFDQALFVGNVLGENFAERKKSPRSYQKVSWYNTARIGSPEMILNVEKIRSLGIRFDEDFGVGASNPIGEEIVFVADLKRLGQDVLRIPFILGIHKGKSTGSIFNDYHNNARIRVFNRAYRWLGIVIRFLFLIKNWRRFDGSQSRIFFILGRDKN